MAIQQTGTGYRDATKALSIKALQQRQKDAAAAAATAMAPAQEIANPWQGVGHIANILGTGFTQSRAEGQEADARQRLAEIVAQIDPAKGATAEQQAQVRMLDEDFANKIYEEAAAARAREDEQLHRTQERVGGQEFQAGESQLTRDATAAENDLNRQADLARQKLTDANADNRQEDAQAAAQELAELNARIAEEKAKADQGRTRETKVLEDVIGDENKIEEARVAAEVAAKAAETEAAQADQTAANQTEEAQDQLAVKAGKMTPEVAAQKAADRADKAAADIASTSKGTEFGEIRTGAELGMTDPELMDDSFQKDINTGEWKPVVTGGGTNIEVNTGTAGDKMDETLDVEEGKVWMGLEKQGNVAAGAQADFQMLNELGKSAWQGPIWGQLKNIPGVGNFASVGKAFDSIVKRVAPTLRVEGSGSTSDLEYNGMLDSLPRPNCPRRPTA